MSLPLRKSALAASYFPELASHQACNRLRRWIIRCTELYDKLRATVPSNVYSRHDRWG